MKRFLILVMAILVLAVPATALAVAGSSFKVAVNHGCSDRVNTYYHTAVIRCGAGHSTIVGAKTTDRHISYRGTTLRAGQVFRYNGWLYVSVKGGQHITILRTF